MRMEEKRIDRGLQGGERMTIKNSNMKSLAKYAHFMNKKLRLM